MRIFFCLVFLSFTGFPAGAEDIPLNFLYRSGLKFPVAERAGHTLRFSLSRANHPPRLGGNPDKPNPELSNKTGINAPPDIKSAEPETAPSQRESAPSHQGEDTPVLQNDVDASIAPSPQGEDTFSVAGGLKTPPENAGGADSANSPEFFKDKGNNYFYNQGIRLLKEGKDQKALPFLQKSFYQYLFFPAHQALSRLQRPPPRLWPGLWHVTAGLYGLFTLFWLGFLLKKSAPAFLLKGVILWFCGTAALALSAVFSLQKRAGALTDLEGRSAPFEESVVLWTAPEGADVTVLKTDRQWTQIKTADGQKGWVKSKNLLLTLE